MTSSVNDGKDTRLLWYELSYCGYTYGVHQSEMTIH